MKLIFGTGNAHKVAEAKNILKQVEVVSSSEAGVDLDVEETGQTFAENALIKAEAIFKETGVPCFAEDSGLVVRALDDAPGIYSARYAQRAGSELSNLELVLQQMKGKADRHAYFIASIALVGVSPEPVYFEGRVYGELSSEPQGDQGFGYDPIFIPEGYDKTFAELGPEVKDEVSHRKKALEAMKSYISAL